MTIHPYLSPCYALACKTPQAEPIYLPANKLWLLKRPIASSGLYDLVHCYPFLPLQQALDWDLDHDFLLTHKIVSVTLMTDVFFQPSGLESLAKQFDYAAPYKTHYIVDFDQQAVSYGKNHRRNVSKAYKNCQVKVVELKDFLAEWCGFYQSLAERHNISLGQRFTDQYFAQLAQIPGLIMIGAFAENTLISAMLWLEHHGFVYSHLAASSQEGYKKMCPYAIYDYSIRYFNNLSVKMINLGGGAGVDKASEGLVFFKQGFANSNHTCFIAGKIIDPISYQYLSSGYNNSMAFFPAYRAT